MLGLSPRIIGAALAVAMPAAAIAATPVRAPQPTAPAAAAAAAENPWLALSAMTSGGAANTAAIAGAQDDDDCDRRADDDDGCGLIPFAPLSVALGAIALSIWILVHDNRDDNLGLPVSP